MNSTVSALGSDAGRGGVEDTRLEAKDTKKIRGQGQGPRTQSASALQKKKKKRSSQKFFRRSPKKKKRSSQKFFKRSPLKIVFQKIFQALHKILTFQKIVLPSSRGQANFRGLEASRPRPRTSKSVLEDVLEAKDVLEDSTSGCRNGGQLPLCPFTRRKKGGQYCLCIPIRLERSKRLLILKLFIQRIINLIVYEQNRPNRQRWSPRGRPWPRGHILKSLALAFASKIKSLALASRPQVLENCPVLGSRTALFFE